MDPVRDGLTYEEEEKLLNAYVDRINQREQEIDLGVGESELTGSRRQALLPSVKDPKLWMVRCKAGHEKEAVISLMNKYIAMQGTGNELHILSATTSDRVSGFAYVEAFKEVHVR